MRNSRIKRNIKLGLKDILLHKGRSVLTSLGVVFGVGSVIAMLSVGEGASEQAMAQIRKLGSNNILLSSAKPTEDVNSGSTKKRAGINIYGLQYDDELRIRESFPHVKRTAPARILRKPARLGKKNTELRVVGTTQEWFRLVKRPLLAGRFFNRQDVLNVDAVCVLTEHGARKLLANDSTIGRSVILGGDYFKVVGIIEGDEAAEGIQTPDLKTDAYIPITTYTGAYGESSYTRRAGSHTLERVELHNIIIEVDDMEHVPSTAIAVEAMLKRFHKKVDYEMNVPLALLRQAEESKRMFNIVLGSIAGISLLVGGIGIMNIMLASVTERTREIGIRRAIGAKRSQIVIQFLIETVVLSGLGGMIGILVGVFIPWAITKLTEMPTVVPLYSVVLSLGVSMTIGVVFGLYPAIRAAQLDPIEALRHE
ncbi:MAG: ABC transporter permease [Kiritimatiellae bacterium]|nr:ABC transporter permease [Kiritimatiellia bacterium]